MKKILILLSLFTVASQARAGVFTSLATGNWNSPNTWTLSSGSDADGIPDADDDVTIAAANTITLTQNEACNNLTHPGGSATRLVCATNVLEINGVLSFAAAVSGENYITSSSSTSGIRFVGAGRNPLMGTNSGAFGTGYSVEVACSGTSTLSGGNLKFANLNVTSGTVNLGGELRLAAAGFLTIAAGATVSTASRVGTTSATASTFGAGITVNGTLETSGTIVSGTAITINGTFRVKGTLTITSNPSSALDPEWVYGAGAVVEYNASGECSMGAEIDRAASTANPVIPILRVNGVSAGNAVQTNFKTPRVNNLDFVNGKARCNGSNLVIVSGGTITGASATNYVVTASTTAGLRREGVGSVTATGGFPIGTTTAYLPVTAFNNTGTSDIFTAHVSATAPACVAPASTVTATWDITEFVAGGSNCDISVDYGAAAVGGSFVAGSAKIVHCNGATPDYANGSVTGTVASGSGFTTFSPFGVSSDAILPLELKSFTGQIQATTNMLRWETLTEKNVQSHIVERSIDGNRWSEVGRVAGKGDSQVAVKYSLEDRAPLAKAYYRLRSVDFDGKENLSNSIVLNRKGDQFGITSVFPSPAVDRVTVQFNATKDEKVTVSVTDMTGRLVMQQITEAVKDINELPITLTGLQAGVYSVTVSNSTGASAPVRFVKQ